MKSEQRKLELLAKMMWLVELVKLVQLLWMITDLCKLLLTGLGPVSRKPRKVFGPEKPTLKVCS